MVCLANNPTALELYSRLRAGDDEATAHLMELYGSTLRRRLGGRLNGPLGGRVDVDDVLQTAFHNFYAASQRGTVRFDTEAELWRYLWVTALNCLRAEVARHRAARRDASRSQNLADLPVTEQPESSRHRPSAVHLSLDLRESLGRLDEDQRRVVELRMQEYGVDQIAAMTGRPKRTVERTLQKARRRLEHLISE